MIKERGTGWSRIILWLWGPFKKFRQPFGPESHILKNDSADFNSLTSPFCFFISWSYCIILKSIKPRSWTKTQASSPFNYRYLREMGPLVRAIVVAARVARTFYCSSSHFFIFSLAAIFVSSRNAPPQRSVTLLLSFLPPTDTSQKVLSAKVRKVCLTFSALGTFWWSHDLSYVFLLVKCVVHGFLL